VVVVVTADPEIPVPPARYGGIERIVDVLVCGLAARGHDVHLFAHPASTAPVPLVPYRGRRSQSLWDTVRHSVQIWRQVQRLPRVDVIHSFGRLAYLLPVLRSSIPKVHSYQRHVSPRSVRLARRLAGATLSFTACSRYCAATAGQGTGDWTIVPNGVAIGTYTFAPAVPADAPLVFLGRLDPIKGAHVAIEVARRAGRRLVIAGNRAADGPAREYFEREIAAHCDGRAIVYVGEVTDAEKSALLGGAAALLFPVEWGEPFGIVMVEALACGTPVLAFTRGAVPEVIEDGRTGVLCESVDEMVAAASRILSLSRAACRASFDQRFSGEVLVARYEQLYRELIARSALSARGVAP